MTKQEWEKEFRKQFYDYDGTLHIGGERLVEMEDYISLLISQELSQARREERERIEKGIRSFIALNQQNRAYNNKKEPYTQNIELLDRVLQTCVLSQPKRKLKVKEEK